MKRLIKYYFKKEIYIGIEEKVQLLLWLLPYILEQMTLAKGNKAVDTFNKEAVGYEFKVLSHNAFDHLECQAHYFLYYMSNYIS